MNLGSNTHAEATVVVKLSVGEVEALAHYAAGRSGKEAARLVGCSHESIRDRTQRARLKLGAHTTAQAVAIAMRHGILK